jgi:Trypsin
VDGIVETARLTLLRRYSDQQKLDPHSRSLRSRVLETQLKFKIFQVNLFLLNSSRSATQFVAVLAEHNLKDFDKPRRKTMRIKQIVLHPSYASVQKLNDIALLRLEGGVEWNDFVQPICLPDAGDNSFDGISATVAGWGNTKSTGEKLPS